MSKEETQTDQSETRLYELAFNIIPTVGDSEVEGVFAEVKKLVEKVGKVTNSSSPAMIPLAYVMDKTIESKKRKYNTAYFAWIKFEATPETIETLKHDLDLNSSVLRYLILKTTKESTISADELANVLRDEETKEESNQSENIQNTEGEEIVDSPEVSETEENNEGEIDKAIDDLVKDEKEA